MRFPTKQVSFQGNVLLGAWRAAAPQPGGEGGPGEERELPQEK